MAIYAYRDSIAPFPLMVCNTSLFGWESDVLFVSKDNYVTEYEIKICRSDYNADKSKYKHRLLINHVLPLKQFYYVTPKGLLDGLPIPDHAGLIEVEVGVGTVIKKQAPKLSKSPITTETLINLLGRGCNKYWFVKERWMKDKQHIAALKQRVEELQHPAKAEEE